MYALQSWEDQESTVKENKEITSGEIFHLIQTSEVISLVWGKSKNIDWCQCQKWDTLAATVETSKKAPTALGLSKLYHIFYPWFSNNSFQRLYSFLWDRQHERTGRQDKPLLLGPFVSLALLIVFDLKTISIYFHIKTYTTYLYLLAFES